MYDYVTERFNKAMLSGNTLQIALAVEEMRKQDHLNWADSVENTALMAATILGHLDAVKLLVEAGADVNVRSKDGTTALSVAKKKGYAEIVDILEKVTE